MINSLEKFKEKKAHETIQPQQLSMIRSNAKRHPRQVNIPNIVAIYGDPNCGKSSLGDALSKSKEFMYVSTDAIFASYLASTISNKKMFMVNPGQPIERFNVGKYVDSDRYDHGLFIACLKEELAGRLYRSPETQTVLLDGYVLKHYSRIFADLGFSSERTLVLKAYIVNDRYMIEGFDVTDHRYDAVLKHIRASFSEKCINITLPKSRYQNFSSFNLPRVGNSGSDTLKKYNASHLEDIVQADDNFVDIGCNAGYFCFRVAGKTNGSIVGVDIVNNWLETASHINSSIFRSNNISFVNAQAWEFLSNSPSSYEVIHCASTYHYFRERQIVFLREAHRALTANGILVLEVELANTSTEPEITKRARGVDSEPCWFPNNAMFLQQIDGLFNVEAKFESVFQKGSFYNRVYFHLRPIRVDKRFVLDKAQGNTISGWAMYSATPHRKMQLLIKVKDKEFFVVADRFRSDLLQKGIHPTGNCGFLLKLPAEDILFPSETVYVLAVGDTQASIKLLTATKAR